MQTMANSFGMLSRRSRIAIKKCSLAKHGFICWRQHMTCLYELLFVVWFRVVFLCDQGSENIYTKQCPLPPLWNACRSRLLIVFAFCSGLWWQVNTQNAALMCSPIAKIHHQMSMNSNQLHMLVERALKGHFITLRDRREIQLVETRNVCLSVLHWMRFQNQAIFLVRRSIAL